MNASSTQVAGSILFTDLVGFTEFNGVAGDAAALVVLEHQTDLVEHALTDTGDGRIVKELGDGLMIWFEAPGTAVRGSLAILAAVDRARTTDGFPLAVRMGLHHGVAMTRGDDLVGQAVNIAARIADLAGPGELLLSDAVADAADGPAPTPVGPVRVKGVADPIWLYRL